MAKAGHGARAGRVMGQYGGMNRLMLLCAAVLLAVSGCSEAQQAVDQAEQTRDDVTSGASKVQECAALAADAARARLGQVGQVDAQAAREAADRVAERVGSISDADVRAAAEQLQGALVAAADVAERGDTQALDAARQQVTDAAKNAAQTCGLPEGAFTATG